MEIIDSILWFLILNLFGILSLPIAYRVFPSLPDRGITLALPLGLLLIGCGVWFVGLTHTIPNSWWSSIVSLFGLSGVAFACCRRILGELYTHIVRNFRLVIFSELLFCTVFVLVTLMRSVLPDIVHTEQPMDFMMLNAVVVSPHYPPSDPWLAGYSVSYYYLGYVLIGSVSLLSGISTSVAYNLGLASVAALSAVAVFGTSFNIARLCSATNAKSILVGLLSVFLLLVASNLEGALELVRAGGLGSTGFWLGVSVDGLNVPSGPASGWLPGDSGWWWWRASRVIPGTINEFPLFSFLLGDLHPHVMAIPFVLLSICVAIQVYLQPEMLRLRSLDVNLPIALIAVVVVGGLSAINLWDMPLAILLVFGALLLNAARNGRLVNLRLGRVVIASFLLIAVTFVVFSHFYLSFNAPTGGIFPVRGIKSAPIHLFLVWGGLGILALATLSILFTHSMKATGRRGMRLGSSMLIGFAPIIIWMQPIWGIVFYVAVIGLFSLAQMGYRLPRVDEMPFAIGSGMTRIAGTALIIGLLLWDGISHGERGVAGQLSAIDRLLVVVPMGIIVSLALYGAWSIAFRHAEPVIGNQPVANTSMYQYRASSLDGEVPTLGLIAIAVYLLMGAELFYVADFFGGDLRRMNTVFKFYYQAWILFSVIGGVGVWFVFRSFDRSRLLGRLMTGTTVMILLIMLALVSYYPMAAITSRISSSTNTPLTLDGQAYMNRNVLSEWEAIGWIRETTSRESIILESAVVPCPQSSAGCSDFTQAGRIAASTGRPTVVGWDQHEYQWRGQSSLLATRRMDVQTLYQTTIPSLARELVRKYQIQYIVVGPRERAAYGVGGIGKFDDLGEVVFSAGVNGSKVVIYRVASEVSPEEVQRS